MSRRRYVQRGPVGREGEASVVYAVQAAAGGLVKLGVAANFPRRLMALRGMSPVPLMVLATVPGGYDSEQLVFELLAAERAHGEWFRASETVLAVVTAMRSFIGMDYDTARGAFFDVVRLAVVNGAHTGVGTPETPPDLREQSPHTPGDCLLRLPLVPTEVQGTKPGPVRTPRAREVDA